MLKYVSFKFFIDFIFSLIIILLLLPFLLLLLFTITIDLRENPLFIQKRIGFRGKVFNLYKLKTMRSLKDGKGKLLSDFKRTTSIGKIIRTLSIDEIPQIFNVLKGEMSFVGPRPLLLEYLPLYNVDQMKRVYIKNHNYKTSNSKLKKINYLGNKIFESNIEEIKKYL